MTDLMNDIREKSLFTEPVRVDGGNTFSDRIIHIPEFNPKPLFTRAQLKTALQLLIVLTLILFSTIFFSHYYQIPSDDIQCLIFPINLALFIYLSRKFNAPSSALVWAVITVGALFCAAEIRGYIPSSHPSLIFSQLKNDEFDRIGRDLFNKVREQTLSHSSPLKKLQRHFHSPFEGRDWLIKHSKDGILISGDTNWLTLIFSAQTAEINTPTAQYQINLSPEFITLPLAYKEPVKHFLSILSPTLMASKSRDFIADQLLTLTQLYGWEQVRAPTALAEFLLATHYLEDATSSTLQPALLDRAISYYRQALKKVNRRGEPELVAVIENNLAVALLLDPKTSLQQRLSTQQRRAIRMLGHASTIRSKSRKMIAGATLAKANLTRIR
jgi:hypothetical protein